MSIANEFQDFFKEDLLGMPPECEIDIVVYLDPNTNKFSIHPYRIALAELKELKLHLKSLLYKGSIRPSISPWCDPMLFIKRKAGWLLPIIYDLLDQLQGSSFLSKIRVSTPSSEIRGHS